MQGKFKVQYEHLQIVLFHGPKFRELQPINWNLNFKITLDSITNYARAWEEVELGTL